MPSVKADKEAEVDEADVVKASVVLVVATVRCPWAEAEAGVAVSAATEEVFNPKTISYLEKYGKSFANWQKTSNFVVCESVCNLRMTTSAEV